MSEDEDEDSGTGGGVDGDGDDGVVDSKSGVDNSKDNDDNENEDLEHEREDLQELEQARKERMDLMAKELAIKQAEQEKERGKNGGEVNEMAKFQYLIGQSEVFAHFLAGELQIDEWNDGLHGRSFFDVYPFEVLSKWVSFSGVLL